MGKPLVFLFSGQGSQFYHMGKELFDQNDIFRKWMSELDSMVFDIIGDSILDHIYDKNRKKSDPFDHTLYANLAIFMVEYALARVLIENGIRPDYVLGYSLGEFVCAAVTKVMSVEDVLDVLIKQVEVLETHCNKGGMLAVLDGTHLADEPFIRLHSEFAADNFATNFVVSGDVDRLQHIQDKLVEDDIPSRMLPVQYAFHSSHLDPIEHICKKYLQKKKYHLPDTPFISSCRAAIMTRLDYHHFWDVLRKPIRFRETILWLEQDRSHVYVDLGPSATLATFVKYILAKNSRSRFFSILTPFGNESNNNLDTFLGIGKTQGFIKSDREAKNLKSIVFPGQGSQIKGMGAGLFEKFADLTSMADTILGYSIKELCLENPGNNLFQTEYTQPALYIVNAFTYFDWINNIDNKPDYVAGHSLGEYNALLAAGAFDFETGLRLVIKRGKLMSRASGGGMAAVIGLGRDEIERLKKHHRLENIFNANINSQFQIVLSGLRSEIDRARTIFENAGAKRYVPLPVSGAFHTQFMQSAQDEFAAYLAEFELADLVIPVISNVSARPYDQTTIKETLAAQIVSPVNWHDGIRYLIDHGVRDFKEIGPGTVLTGLLERIKQELSPRLDGQKTKEAEDSTPIKNGYSGKGDSGISFQITAESLGCDEFKKDYNIKYAYLTGSMGRAISSKELVATMAKSGLFGFFGTGGLSLGEIESSIQWLDRELQGRSSFGMNLLPSLDVPHVEEEIVDLFLNYGIRNIEASSYVQITPALIKYRLTGIHRDEDGVVQAPNRIMAKLSRPEVAQYFLSPAPRQIVDKLLNKGQISTTEAKLSQFIPVADDVCAAADSGGHTEQAVASALVPSIIRLRDEIMRKYKYSKKIRIGAAGGIGTPEAAAAAFILGADFIVTGSINQCTVEAGTSDAAKELLQQMNVQDTAIVPAGDIFEMGTKVQVLKKGVLFPARANRLFDLYKQYGSLAEIDDKSKRQLQDNYFKQSFAEMFAEAKKNFHNLDPAEVLKAEQNPKDKMKMVFNHYLSRATEMAVAGDEKNIVNYQIPCGPALGAFNQWVKGTELEDWRNRHVDRIADKLMQETASLLNQRFRSMMKL